MLEHRIVSGNPSHVSHYCLVLHGLGDSMEGWMPVVHELPVRGLAWVFVNAPEPYFGGWSWFPIPGMTDPAHDAADLAHGLSRSRALLQELIVNLLGRLDVSTGQLLLMGFSQGATMVVDQALRSDAVFAGVLGISGWIACTEDYPGALGAAAAQQRFLLTHGDHDEVVPVELAEASAEAVRRHGPVLPLHRYAKGHSLDPSAELPALRSFLTTCVEGRA